MTGMLDTTMTPKALKNFSKSVLDLSSLKEVKEISKSTSNLMSGGVLDQIKIKKTPAQTGSTSPAPGEGIDSKEKGKMTKKSKAKSESKTFLLKSSTESLIFLEVGAPTFSLPFA